MNRRDFVKSLCILPLVNLVPRSYRASEKKILNQMVDEDLLKILRRVTWDYHMTGPYCFVAKPNQGIYVLKWKDGDIILPWNFEVISGIGTDPDFSMWKIEQSKDLVKDFRNNPYFKMTCLVRRSPFPEVNDREEHFISKCNVDQKFIEYARWNESKQCFDFIKLTGVQDLRVQILDREGNEVVVLE